MFLIDQFSTPGEHALMLQGLLGPVEAVLSIPDLAHNSYVALLGHPHSLQGGTMNNKVVTTMARAFRELNIPSLRFNFRGVGHSAGQYDHGIGESDDMLFLAHSVQKIKPDVCFIFAGFSFGSYVAYRAAARCACAVLISIAPPVHHFNYEELLPNCSSWLIIQGTEDNVVPAPIVEDFVAHNNGAVSLITFPDTGHFFHGKLIELKNELIHFLRSALCL